ncbi:MAG: SAM-dependent methyltransferase [Anaerolineaceae bacterium]
MTLDLSPGKAALGNARLVRAIAEEMDGGAISFQRFMELALYHPEWGYYRTPGRVGRQGDFLTSPTIHPMFGWIVAAWCKVIWDSLGRPNPFHIIEPGAGSGALGAAILDWAEGRDDGFREVIRYVALEPNSPGTDPRIDWRLPPIPTVDAGVVVTNELFDAFPVRLFHGAGARGAVEVYVRWDGDQFVETAGSVTRIDDAPAEGRFEVNPGAFPTMESLCSLIERGAVLVFDYGYPQAELWAPWRKAGTLLCFYRHTAHENPYIHVGEQDITTHVNFSELRAAANGARMQTFGPISQAAFLHGLGAQSLVDSSRGEMAEYFARRRALEQLTDGAGLGRVRVLAATRGIKGTPPGFEDVQ